MINSEPDPRRRHASARLIPHLDGTCLFASPPVTWALDSTARDSPALAPAPAPRALRLVPQPQRDPAQALPVKEPSKSLIGRHIRKVDLTAPQGRQVTSSRTGTWSAGRPQIKSWQLRRPPPEKSWLPLRSSEYPIQIIIPEVRLFFSASTDLPFQFLPYNTCRIFHHKPNRPADQIRNQAKSYWDHPKEPSSSLFKQVMRSQAAAAHHTSSSQSPPRQPKENARQQNGPNGLTVGDPGLLPPPSAPPTLVSALKGINGAPDPLVTLREKPREHSFDSPYARSANSTAPGSPRM